MSAHARFGFRSGDRTDGGAEQVREHGASPQVLVTSRSSTLRRGGASPPEPDVKRRPSDYGDHTRSPPRAVNSDCADYRRFPEDFTTFRPRNRPRVLVWPKYYAGIKTRRELERLPISLRMVVPALGMSCRDGNRPRLNHYRSLVGWA